MDRKESLDDVSVQLSNKTPRLPARFRVKSNKYGVYLTCRTLLPFPMFIVVFGFLIESNLTTALIAYFIFGWSAYRIQFVLHDTCHMSLFSNRRANDLVGKISGLFILNYFPRYRAIHFLHHKYNGLIEDPQLPDYLSDTQLNKKSFIKFLIEPLYGARVIPYFKRDLLEAKVLKVSIPKPSVIWWVSAIFVQLSIAMILTKSFRDPYFLISLYLGLTTFSLFLARLRTLAEHQQVNSTYKDFSRTHPRNWLDTLLLQDANFCYHLEHHLYPSVQSRHLPELFSELTSELHTKDSMGKSMIETLKFTYAKL
jgi:fatty acid desaturase